MTKLWSAALVFAFAGACKGKEPSRTSTAPPTPATTPAPPTTAPSPAPPAKPAANAAVIPSGPMEYGCIGWAPATKTAACLVGRYSTSDDTVVQLAFVGTDDEALEVGFIGATADERRFDDESLPALNAALASAGYQTLPGEGTDAAEGARTELAPTVALQWTKRSKGKTPNKLGPWDVHAISLTCGDKATPIVTSEDPGIEPSVKTWSIGGHVLMQVIVRHGYEGEVGETASAYVLEVATCTLTSATP